MVIVQTVAKALPVLLLVLAGSVSSGLASHTEPHETGWFEFQYNEDDSEVLYCNALAYITVGDLYIQDRPGPGDLYGTGLVGSGGGGTWIAHETNGIPGYQVAGEFLFVDILEGGLSYAADPASNDCPENGDQILY